MAGQQHGELGVPLGPDRTSAACTLCNSPSTRDGTMWNPNCLMNCKQVPVMGSPEGSAPICWLLG